jgi:hypothetical protein
MTDKMQADFEAWYLSETGITYQDASDRGVYDLKFLQRCWQAATRAKRERCAKLVDGYPNCADAIRLGGEV